MLFYFFYLRICLFIKINELLNLIILFSIFSSENRVGKIIKLNYMKNSEKNKIIQKKFKNAFWQ